MSMRPVSPARSSGRQSLTGSPRTHPELKKFVRDQFGAPSERQFWWRSYSGHHGIDVGRDPVAGERGILRRNIAG